jgi:hypothetical protein
MVEKFKSTVLNGNNTIANIVDQIKLVNKKLDLLIELNEKILKTRELQTTVTATSVSERLVPDTISLLSLPMSLRKTIMVLYKLEKATAEGLAKETGRLRAVESSAANQLVRMGYLSKKREGRDVVFFIETGVKLRK